MKNLKLDTPVFLVKYGHKNGWIIVNGKINGICTYRDKTKEYIVGTEGCEIPRYTQRRDDIYTSLKEAQKAKILKEIEEVMREIKWTEGALKNNEKEKASYELRLAKFKKQFTKLRSYVS